MKDFEVHPIGTAMEIKLARELIREVGQVIEQYGEVVPHNVRMSYNRLLEQYKVVLQNEENE